MKLGFPVPTAYRRSLRFALVVQLVALLLSACVDDNGSFIPIAVAAWAAFWVGALAMIHRRQTPTGAELVGLRYGPLAIPTIIFIVGQYV
jgi:hypothetical protein